MSSFWSFWSLWITIIALANIFACVWLIRWTEKKRPGEAASHETTGHEWDGLQEYNNPMPRWWLWLFYITIVFGLIYLVLYPGLGGFKGVLGWSQYTAWQEEVDTVEERVAPLFAQYAEMSIPDLAAHDEAMQTGRRLFGNNCAVCHGADGGGRIGFPNIANNDWQWGGEPEQIYKSILDGRAGVMPGMGRALGEQGVTEVSAYVFSLSGRGAPEDLVTRGRERFQALCASCHGSDARGNTAMGAPNLTDGNWTYGGSLEAIRTSVRDGRRGRMPAQKDLLGEDRVHLLAAYVYSLSMDERENAAADNADE
ncbi:cytochrome c oxidase cbb3-type subunit 3 [Natronocella acetinitrilica]|uniref:Cbb3-type cytochrome c oxidase subunit n=1 Tax=Natronocella acetinitrilica TaxID=414046 RepID=A0AAE3KC90_9GAMM|nr:cytochrome-c oxidase, cbb3-type subunit III [Natronocella acetinitrilica]MCP1674658.1 cytochrome c oxidase cbb3-type subunit 3 [Natronocella acetinitrilica]